MPRSLATLVPAWCLVFTIGAQSDLPRRRFRPWGSFAQNPQHTALSPVRSQSLDRVLWRATIDFQPPFTKTTLAANYGSPVITSGNTVIFPVKTSVDGDFRLEARSALDGSLNWSMTTDYVLPPHGWVPVVQPAITVNSRVYFPGAGGTLYYRDNPDSPSGASGQVAFYGLDQYLKNRALYDGAVMINTPLTADAAGNVYFGFKVVSDASVALRSGIARIGADGQGTWTPAATAAADQSIIAVAQNCAPAVTTDGARLYIAVIDPGNRGYLAALDAATLSPKGRVRLTDPDTGDDALLPPNGTASPMIGWDGDVYFGVFESAFENHDRGWLLHFDALLSRSRIPGAFGWDDTPSLVPASMVPTYTGTSAYLLMTKYNNYFEAGGDGRNRIAVLDPNQQDADAVTGVMVMREVSSIVAPTLEGDGPGVLEWCINSAAVDPFSRSVIVNNEDGNLYRWDLASNSFTETLVLTGGVPEPYTPTAIGPDGTVYAINNSSLFAIGRRR